MRIDLAAESDRTACNIIGAIDSLQPTRVLYIHAPTRPVSTEAPMPPEDSALTSNPSPESSSPSIVADETPWTPPAPHPAPELPANVIAVTYDRSSKWWTARCGPADAEVQAVSNIGPFEALAALVASLRPRGYSFDPDFTLAS